MRSMREVGGYVKLYRSFLDWEWYDDEACHRLFIHFLMIANWQESRWQGQTIPAGSKIISQVELAKRFGWSRQKLGRTLDKLKSTGEVISKPGTKWTLVTVANWAKYQGQDATTGHQSGNDRASIGHQPGTDKESKNIRSKEVNTAPPSAVRELVWPIWAGDQTKAKWSEFVAYRKSSHRFTYKSVQTEQSAINLLAKYYKNGKDCFAGLEEAMAKGWRFPVEPTAKIANGKATAMSREDAERTLADIRKQNGIEPGGIVETQLIPKDVLETLRRA